MREDIQEFLTESAPISNGFSLFFMLFVRSSLGTKFQQRNFRRASVSDG